jgi:hypothetical protein
MNKTSYQPNRNIKTQNNFRKRAAQSPFRSQKSFEEGSKVDSVKMEMLLNRQHGTLCCTQVSPVPVGAYSTLRASSG